MASSDNKAQEKAPAQEQTKAEETQKPTTAAALGEDDEFEDFPVDGAWCRLPLPPASSSFSPFADDSKPREQSKEQAEAISGFADSLPFPLRRRIEGKGREEATE